MLAVLDPAPLIIAVAFILFVVGTMVYSSFQNAEISEKHTAARRLAARGDTKRALDLIRQAKKLLPTGENGSATPEFVEMATFEAVLEERLRNERALRSAAKSAETAPAVAATLDPETPAARASATTVVSGARVGEYILEEKIGEGGFGQVWRAHHAALHTIAAVKIPNRVDAAAKESLGRLARIQRRLDDPRIVRILAADLDADPPYVAMELVEGMDLRKLLEVKGRLEPSYALGILEEALAALAVAHGAGITHRDLKPENILIAEGGGVKLTDFELGGAGPEGGQAQLSAGLASTASDGGTGGTLAYMAPEQLAGEAGDARADVYAIGVILFELLTGKRPHPGDQPSQFREGLPPVCDALFLRCYTRLERRFPSAREALAALREGAVPKAHEGAVAKAGAPAAVAEVTARRS